VSKARKTRDIGRIMREGTEVDAALRRAARRAVEQHRRAGQRIVVWRNGRSVWIPPQEIRLEPEGKA
jgi:hypothetical protein